MSQAAVLEVLTEIATKPMALWESLLHRRFPTDPLMVRQALLWLHADHDQLDESVEPPTLGALGDERYELTIKLDSGATASVWQAFDRKLGRNVAIKILHHGEPRAVAQVIAEARAACDVISDHVVRILDVHDGGARPFIVMELVGEHDPAGGKVALGTAASVCRPGDVHEVARWVMHVARGVHDAHLRNVFHRDLKPSNVLITPISRRARIADFGLAVSAANEDVDLATSTLLTDGPGGPISVTGTPEYMAPEQARGLPRSLDPRSAEDHAVLVAVDVWGLGALAYDLLSGAPPWLTSDDVEPWERAASGARPRDLERTPHGDRIPRRLRRIVDKAMALDPTARYASAAQVANELAALLARQPTCFDRTWRSRAQLWCLRNPQLTLTGLVMIGLVLLTLGTRATVARLRGERRALNEEVASQERKLEQLTTSVSRTRAALKRTEQQLQTGAGDLVDLEQTIRDERKVYETVLRQRETALREATAATRQLVEELDVTRRERNALKLERSSLETRWAAAQRDADRTTAERDQARRDRDTARAERDTTKHEREAATAELEQARRELVRLRDERTQTSDESSREP